MDGSSEMQATTVQSKTSDKNDALCQSCIATIFFKSSKSRKQDSYFSALKDAIPLCREDLTWNVPVLRFTRTPQRFHEQYIQTPDSCRAIIVTSPRAAAMIAEAVSGLEDADLRHKWTAKPIFVVGKATSAALGGTFHRVLGQESGNASILADVIVEQFNGVKESDSPTHMSNSLLFLCGGVKSDTLPTKLREAGFNISECVVYEATPIKYACLPPEITTKLQELSVHSDDETLAKKPKRCPKKLGSPVVLPGGDGQACCNAGERCVRRLHVVLGYFSPRGVLTSFDAIVPSLLQYLADRCRCRHRSPDTLLLCAIGPSTQKALVSAVPRLSGCHGQATTIGESSSLKWQLPTVELIVACAEQPNANSFAEVIQRTLAAEVNAPTPTAVLPDQVAKLAATTMSPRIRTISQFSGCPGKKRNSMGYPRT